MQRASLFSSGECAYVANRGTTCQPWHHWPTMYIYRPPDRSTGTHEIGLGQVRSVSCGAHDRSIVGHEHGHATSPGWYGFTGPHWTSHCRTDASYFFDLSLSAPPKRRGRVPAVLQSATAHRGELSHISAVITSDQVLLPAVLVRSHTGVGARSAR